jgi:hypothetical protein
MVSISLWKLLWLREKYFKALEEGWMLLVHISNLYLLGWELCSEVPTKCHTLAGHVLGKAVIHHIYLAICLTIYFYWSPNQLLWYNHVLNWYKFVMDLTWQMYGSILCTHFANKRAYLLGQSRMWHNLKCLRHWFEWKVWSEFCSLNLAWSISWIFVEFSTLLYCMKFCIVSKKVWSYT